MKKESQQNITDLEAKVEQLLELSRRLSAENVTLKQELQAIKADRSGLIEQKQQVRDQVEKMIGRLKSLETT
ncbi:MAG: TIGR02449 family protein [Gammaproteobacteria bacterium]|nr:TIGR02449 family protein [Gammaproteobacteria bacterium]